MADISQFQQYSQGENTITNNVLLMLKSIYEIDPRFYEQYVNSLAESDLIEVMPVFRQQVGNRGNGCIDGHISTKRSSIIFETKIHSLETIDKLLKYTDSFNEDEISILFHMSSVRYDEKTEKEINKRLSEKKQSRHVKFYSITYSDLVDQLEELHKKYIYVGPLEKLFLSFQEYCQNMKLLHSQNNVLRAMACGHSIDLNLKHSFYFDLEDRGFSPFRYFGIYHNKAVRHLALVENEVVADWSEQTGLTIKDGSATQDQVKRLSKAIKEAVDAGWNIATNHRFFMLKNLTETNFQKTSPGGIFRVRYFNLEDELGKKVPEKIEDVAMLLSEKTWR